MKKTFYSNGKLLLTGEYAVLDGATALAIPTKYGQSLAVTPNNSNLLEWASFDDKGAIWFKCKLANKANKWTIYEVNDTLFDVDVSKTLLTILTKAQELNPLFLKSEQGITVNTHLDFPRDWGLGTSSTLINNIAQWAQIDAFQLLDESFGGSGYDIAAAQNDQPIFYQRSKPPTFRSVHLPWEFKDQLFFVHLNQKQDSKKGIAHYKSTAVSKLQLLRISDLSEKLLMCYSLTDFQKIMEHHEKLISEMIDLPTVKERLFSDYGGLVKSLGAWGGDFILVSGTLREMDYFRSKGYRTIISYPEMIK